MSISPKISTVRDLNKACCTGAIGWSGFMPSFSFLSFSGSSSSQAERIRVIREFLKGGESTVYRKVFLSSKCGKNGSKRGPDAVPNHDVGIIVLIGRRPVKNGEFGASPLGEQRKSRRRIDNQ